MPFASKAQQRYMFATMPETAKRWADHTEDFKSLPEKVKKDKKKGKSKGKSEAESKDGTKQKSASNVAMSRKKPSVTPPQFRLKTALDRACDQYVFTRQSPREMLSSVLSTPDKPPGDPSILTEKAAEERIPNRGEASSSNAGCKPQGLVNTRHRLKYASNAYLGETLSKLVSKLSNSMSNSKSAFFHKNLPYARLQKRAFIPVQNPMSMTTKIPHQAGSGVPPTGLDASLGQDARQALGRATAVPGMEGVAAANPIDMHGGLDPRGQILDGNHAAGVQKGFKLAEWVKEKRASLT